MRRKEREVKDRKAIEAILKEATVCRVGFSDNNRPYIVPMNFGYRDSCLYLHSSYQGKKMDILKKNSQVCFEVDIHSELIEGESICKWGMKYLSVLGFGEAHLLEDNIDKRKALALIVGKYSAEGSQMCLTLSDNLLGGVAIIKVAISNMTGKKAYL